MIKRKDLFFVSTVVLSAMIILLLFYQLLFKSSKEPELNQNVPISEGDGKLKFRNVYLEESMLVGFFENGTDIRLDALRFFKAEDTNRLTPIKMSSLALTKRKNLVIRFTEIGCNACADSTFRYLNRHRLLIENYNILVVVDFSNYDSYLKWRKVSEIPYPVVWLKKGDIPLKIEKNDKSFIFIINDCLKVEKIFIPNSLMPEYIDEYFSAIESALLP
jgi:hypothetical protein